jgi:hypothetical protein
MKPSYLLLGLAMVAAVACGPQPTAQAPAGGTGTEPASPVIPQELRHEGFEYYGIGAERRPLLEMAAPAQGAGGVITGSQQFEVVEVTAEGARVRQSWTGNLAASLGHGEVLVTPEGIFSIRLADHPVEPPQMELPARLEEGFTRDSSSTFRLPTGQTVEQKATLTVLGPRQIDTKAGPYDTIAVRLEGTAVVDGVPMPVRTVTYYAKGVGPVRVELHTKAGDKEEVVTLEAAG